MTPGGGGMGMGQGQHQSQRQSLDMRPSPSLIAFTEILQMSGQQLQGLILREVEANPALDLQEVEVCPRCGEPLTAGGRCLRCRSGDDLIDAAQRDVAEFDDEDDDAFRTVADQRSLQEHLREELAMVFDDEDIEIGEYLIGELDDRGFLSPRIVERVSGSLGVAPERVEAALAALQSIGPLGLGARSVEECLGVQLDRWEEAGQVHPLARSLVDAHLEDLAHGRFAHIADVLGTTAEEVIAGRDYIRTHLRPYPIAEHTDLEPWERQTGPGSQAPDVVIRRDERGTLTVEVIESRRYKLSIDRSYNRYVTQIEASGGGLGPAKGSGGPESRVGGRGGGDGESGRAAGPDLSEADMGHIRDQVERARQFLAHIDERRRTMSRVTDYVVRRQEAFIRHGPRELVPLTRAEVAEALSLHESTVSRATAGKHVMLPNRQVIPFSNFFKAALSVQDVLRELVEKEDRPLTDTELAEMLAMRGYRIARRTVAKYRGQLGILPSSLR